MNNKELWVKSPITGKDMVMQEFDEKNGVSKIDLSSGYYTNEYPLNYKKHPNFDINEYESGMPDVVKLLKHDDGESYWYPSTIQTDESFVFPTIRSSTPASPVLLFTVTVWGVSFVSKPSATDPKSPYELFPFVALSIPPFSAR